MQPRTQREEETKEGGCVRWRPKDLNSIDKAGSINPERSKRTRTSASKLKELRNPSLRGTLTLSQSEVLRMSWIEQ